MNSDSILEAAYNLATKQCRRTLRKQGLWPSTPNKVIIFANGPHTQAMLIDKYYERHKARLIIEAGE